MKYKSSKKLQDKGFALISALAILVLLVMLVIGMLSLATTETKSASLDKYKLEAQANARMALMIALGELQEMVGPDQRITANASIFANDAGGSDPSDQGFDPKPVSGNGIDPSFQNPHLLGVWDSWTTWLSGDNDPDEIAVTYDRGRTSNFKKYLVSHPDAEEMTPADWRNQAENGFSLKGGGNLTLIPLIENILGNNPTANDIVRAPLVETPTGGYAWHVSGNNQKTNISLGKEDRDVEVAGSAAELANLSHHGLNEEIDADLAGYPLEAEEAEKALTLQTGTLVDSNATDFLKDYLNENYHTYTANSQSILANVRNGGLKKDLNAYLERDLEINLSGGGTLRQSWGINASNPDADFPVTIRAIDGYLGSPVYPFRNNLNGPSQPNLSSWYKLHQYYQTYKGGDAYVDESADTQPSVTYEKGTAYNPKSPFIKFNLPRGNMYQRGFERTSAISRMFLQIGARKTQQLNGPNAGDDEFLMEFNPVIVVWNPYNMPIQVPRPRGYIRIPTALEFKVTHGATETTWARVPANFIFNGNGGLGNNLTLAPGETRIFSTNPGDENANNLGQKLNNNMIVSPGHTPDELGKIKFLANAQTIANYNPATPTRIHLRLTGTAFTNFETYVFTWGYRTAAPGGERRWAEMGWRTLPVPSANPAPDNETILLTEAGGKIVHQTPSPLTPQADYFAHVGFALKNEDWHLNPAITPAGSNPDRGKDFRTKNYILANPKNARSQVVQNTPRQLGMGQYEFFQTRSVGGGLSVQYDPSTNRSTNFTTYGAGGQEVAPLMEMPISPAYSLAALQQFPLHAGGRIATVPGLPGGHGFHLFEASASNFGLGIGNGYAHPMVEADDIYYQAADGDVPSNFTGTALQARRLNVDVWDHLLIQNDALYDEWFTSSMTQQETETFADKRSLSDVFDEFVDGSKPLPNQHISFEPGAEDVDDIKSTLIGGTDFQEEAFEQIARYLVLNGGFNVNSTSVDAWKGLFYGLRTEEFQYLPVATNSTIQTHSLSSPEVVISRMGLPNSNLEGTDKDDPASWRGVRYLTEEQIDKLAEECVRQVKLRGPFLNMSDFVNRRLDPNDPETSRVGALQAAIDWDEFNGNTIGNDDSINARFKQGTDMITASNSTDTWGGGAGGTLPFAEAFYGSRWTGIPGYVMQGDLMKRIGNQLTVRDDTFTIRAYGESKDAQGKVQSRVVCEAVVQRTPRYVNHKDTGAPDADGAPPETVFDDLANNDLTNRRYGRKLVIKSFRWLSDSEI